MKQLDDQYVIFWVVRGFTLQFAPYSFASLTVSVLNALFVKLAIYSSMFKLSVVAASDGWVCSQTTLGLRQSMPQQWILPCYLNYWWENQISGVLFSRKAEQGKNGLWPALDV